MARKAYKRQKQFKQQGGAIRHVIGLFASFLCGYLVASVFDLPSFITWANKQWLSQQTLAQGAKPGVPNVTMPVKQAEIPKPKFEFYTLLSKENNPANVTSRDAALGQQVAASSSQLEAALVATPNSVSVKPATELAKSESVAPKEDLLPNEGEILKEDTSIKDEPAEKGSSVQGTKVLESQLLAPQPRAVGGPASVSESKPVSPAPVSSSTARVSGTGTYMIQVAAVTRRQDAERLKESLARKGYSVMIISPSQTRLNWFRVVIGPYHSRPEAEKAQSQVAQTEHIQGMIRKIDV